MIRRHSGRDPMGMTWAVYTDHVRRLVPYLMKVERGTLKADDVEQMMFPLKIPKGNP